MEVCEQYFRCWRGQPTSLRGIWQKVATKTNAPVIATPGKAGVVA
jgi:hypothetical protein